MQKSSKVLSLGRSDWKTNNFAWVDHALSHWHIIWPRSVDTMLCQATRWNWIISRWQFVVKLINAIYTRQHAFCTPYTFGMEGIPYEYYICRSILITLKRFPKRIIQFAIKYMRNKKFRTQILAKKNFHRKKHTSNSHMTGVCVRKSKIFGVW